MIGYWDKGKKVILKLHTGDDVEGTIKQVYSDTIELKDAFWTESKGPKIKSNSTITLKLSSIILVAKKDNDKKGEA